MEQQATRRFLALLDDARWSDAEMLLSHEESQHGGDPSIPLFRGFVAARQQDYGAAIRHATTSIGMDDQFHIARFHRSLWYGASGQWQRCAADALAVTTAESGEHSSSYAARIVLFAAYFKSDMYSECVDVGAGLQENDLIFVGNDRIDVGPMLRIARSRLAGT